MKQKRFLKAIIFGYLCLIGCHVSVVTASDAVQMIEDADGDVVGALDRQTGDMMDLRDATQEDIENIETEISKNSQVTLKDLADQLPEGQDSILSADSPAAQSFMQDNEEVAQAVQQLKTENITIAQPEQPVVQDNITQLRNSNRAMQVVDKISENAETMVKETSSNLNALSKDIQAVKAGKMTLGDFVTRYKRMVSGIDSEALGRLANLRADESIAGQTSVEFAKNGAALKQSMVDSLNNSLSEFSKADAATQQAIQSEIFNQCKDIAIQDGMKSAGDVEESLSKQAGRLSDYDEELRSVLKKQVEDIDGATKDLNPEEFDEEVDTNVKDEHGNNIKESKLNQALKNLEKKVEQSSGNALKLLKSKINVSIDTLGDQVGFWGRRRAALWYRDGALSDKLNELETSLKSVTRNDIADSFSSVTSSVKGLAGKGLALVGEGAKMLVSGVMFMIPNIFQASFLAQKMRQTQLQTLANPIKYGDWVFQIPDSCFNFDNPAATLPIYVRIPVSSTSGILDSATFQAYNGSVSASPTTDNAVSSAIHSIGAAIFSFGGDLSARPQRYKLNEAEYLSYDPGIIVTYFAPGGYQAWGSVAVTSSQFTSGQIIDLTSGVIIDGTGEQVSATGITGFKSYPLSKVVDFHQQQPPSLQPASVKDFLPTMESKFDVSADVVKYIEYDSTTAGTKGSQVSTTLKKMFDCNCLDATSQSSCGQNHACLIDRCLKQYELGLSINADGTAGLGKLLDVPASAKAVVASAVLPSQNSLIENIKSQVAAGVESAITHRRAQRKILGRLSVASPNLGAVDETTSNYLGSVMPMYGWGSGTIFSELINQVTFPNHPTLNLLPLGSANIIRNAAGSGLKENFNFADDSKNYAVQGCWVYLSANTPFAKAVQDGSSETSVYGPYVDYIIFLDEQGTQVPLTVAIEKQNPSQSYTYTTVGLNPNAKYWTSIAAFDSETFTSLPQFQGPNGYPIKYDLQGNAKEDSTLAGKSGVIATAINDLASNFSGGNTNLNAQFVTHQQVMANKLDNGPFRYGNDSLLLDSNYSVSIPASGSSAAQMISVYSGAYAYASAVPDLLVPMNSSQLFDANGQPNQNFEFLALPNAQAKYFASLVTDMIYQVLPDNTLQPLTDFDSITNSMVMLRAGKLVLNQNALKASLQSAASTSMSGFYFLEIISQLGGVVTSVQPYVLEQRKQWSQQFDTSAQKQGIKVGSLTCTLPAEFKTSLALSNKAFIYEISPMPSAAYCDHDFFVLVKSLQPSLSNFVPIDAQFADSSTVAVSLMTGYLFDMTGSQLMNGVDGTPRRIDVSSASAVGSVGSSDKVVTLCDILYNQITGMFPLETIATADFKAKYQSWVQAYNLQMHRPMGPYTFGSLRLGIFAGDFAAGNYVYFDAQGMHKADFEPTDVFVTFDGSSKLGAQLDSTTAYMVSLISGNAYTADGTLSGKLSSAQLLTQTQALEANWGVWLKDTVAQLQKTTVQRIAAENNEQTDLDALLVQVSKQHVVQNDFMTPQSVQEIIKSLEPNGLQGLPAPYGQLQHDPVREIYVNVSPASSDPENLLYLFFYIGHDATTHEHIGGIFTSGGHLVHVVKGVELQVMCNQYGVVVSQDGTTQKLGIPLTQPTLIIQDPKEKLVWGNDSAAGDLIASESVNFPGGTVQIHAKSMWLYYSAIMQNYYVYDFNKHRWMSLVGGHLYQQNGSPIPLAQKVAVLSSKKQQTQGIAAADDLILLYTNNNGQTQGYMSNGQNYANIAESKGVMSWASLTTESNLKVTESQKKNSYIVAGSGASKVYNVSKNSVWYSLFAVPIDDTGSLVTTSIDASVKNAQLVVGANKQVTHMIYKGQMFKVSAFSGNSYTMEPVDPTKPGGIAVMLTTDPDTTAAYVKVVDGKNTYRYLYVMDTLEADEQDFYRAKIKGVQTVATVPFAVGPEVTKTKTIGTKALTVSVPEITTHVLFAQDISPTVSGGLSLNSVAPTAIAGVPTGGQELLEFKKTAAAFYENLGMVLQSSDGRFFVELAQQESSSAVGALSFPYVSNGAYVDLQTGVLYDTTSGICLGYCLQLNDWLTVLNKVCVSVITKTQTAKNALQGFASTSKVLFTNSGLALAYRSPQVVNMQMAELQVDETVVQKVPTFAQPAQATAQS